MHYNDAYYESHYGRLMKDEPYFIVRALYWQKAIQAVWNVPDEGLLLDYGCGTGQVSMAFPNTHFYDIAEFSRNLIKKKGKIVYDGNDQIPSNNFDFILSSHALEHSPRPYDDLINFRRFSKPHGHLLLILPVETRLGPALAVDDNNHLYCWTFQTIGNLLHAAGWEPLVQTYIYDSFLLGRLSKVMRLERAVSIAWRLGRIKRDFKAMMIVARPAQHKSAPTL